VSDLAPQMGDYERNEQHLRPYVTFAARPNLRSAVINTDAEGFRLSAAADGTVSSAGWLAGGGGGLVLGGSWTFGVGATCDGATVPSRLAGLSGSPQLNLGICTANTLQSLIAAIPFLEAAETIVTCNNATAVLTSLNSLGLNEIFGPIRYESMLAGLGAASIGHIAERAIGGAVDGAARLELPRQAAPPAAGADLDARLDASLQRQVRDLRVLSRARRPGSRLLFCHQPFCDPSLRRLTPEERELFDRLAARRAPGTGLRKFVLTRWEACGRRIAAECALLGIDFLDLPADRFTGWSFLDEWHMTDHGYRQAAELIWETLR
jgi:hypothetical protein